MKHGIFLRNKDDNRNAGLIMIDQRGVLIVDSGEGGWTNEVFESLMYQIYKIALPEPLFKKYNLNIENEDKISMETTKQEAWRISKAINDNEIFVLNHQVKAHPIIRMGNRFWLLHK